MSVFIGGWPYVSVLDLPAGDNAFSLPVTPASSTATKAPLAPQFTAGPTGLDTYRPWRVLVMDGELYVFNGYDAPRRWGRAANRWDYLGAAAPTDFGALSLTGAPGTAIPDGVTARYYVVGVNTTLDKETPPQGGADLTIANASGIVKDVVIPWTPGSLPAEFDSRRIYRALNNTDDYKRIATVVDGTGTYTDTTPDSSLLSQAAILAWNGAERTTLPPVFADAVEHKGRMFAFERAGNFIKYGRPIRSAGTAVIEDFPTANVLQVGSDDCTGAPTALVPYQGALTIFKETASYYMPGDDVATWAASRITGSRGTFNRRTVVALERGLLCLDKKGIYRVTPGMYADGTGAVQEMWRAALQPLVDRFNRGASSLFHADLIESESIVVFWVALDFDPTPGHGLVFDHVRDMFLGVITRRNPTAFGYLLGADGSRHPCFGCDMGFLWEDQYAESEGVFAGDNVATLTAGSATTRIFTAAGASFSATVLSGPIGTPLDRYDSSGDVVDENRVYASDATSVTAYLYPTTAYASGDEIAVGVIPGVFESAALSFETHQLKNVRDLYLEFASGVSGSVAIDVKLDDGAWVRKGEQSLATLVRDTMPIANTTDRNDGQSWRFQYRISQRLANLGFSIRAVHIHFDTIDERRR